MKTKVLSTRVTQSDHDLIHHLAEKKGISASHFIAQFIRENLQKKGQKMTEFTQKISTSDKAIYIRFSPETLKKIDERVQAEKIKRSDFIRLCVRNGLGIKNPLTRIEIDAIREAAREVNHIGTNLNQIARKVNSGELGIASRVDTQYMEEIATRVSNVEQTILREVGVV